MASIDTLPPDQRAVLQLLLKRGRTYDEIAKMLSIDRAAVRDRALAALEALGPQTRLSPERRALIADYLLGQLPADAQEQTRERLAASPGERAWARVLASELAPVTVWPLPEIPVETAVRAAPAPPPAPSAPAPSRASAAPSSAGPTIGQVGQDLGLGDPEPVTPRRSSRTGGAVVLGLGVAAAIIVALVLLTGGSSSKHKSTSTARAGASTRSPTSTTPTSSTATHVIAQINLLSPTAGSKTAGIAEVLKRGTSTAIAIVAQAVPPNTAHNAYAVWLYNSPSDNHILGFVNPGVGSTGRLSTAGVLPADASRFKQLLVTLETQAKPVAPGTIILQGTLAIR